MVDRLARRLQAVPPTIFTRMSALAARTGSLNLGQGYPDQDGPQGMLDVATASVLGGAPEAVTAAVLSLVAPGAGVGVVEPFYDSYPAAVEMAGGVRRTVPM